MSDLLKEDCFLNPHNPLMGSRGIQMSTYGSFKSAGVQQVWILVPALLPVFCGTLHSLNASSLTYEMMDTTLPATSSY